MSFVEDSMDFVPFFYISNSFAFRHTAGTSHKWNERLYQEKKTSLMTVNVCVVCHVFTSCTASE